MSEDEAGCRLNTTDLFHRLAFTESPTSDAIAIICPKPIRLYTLPYEGKRYENIEYGLQLGNDDMHGCITNISDWDRLSAATNVRALILLGTLYKTDYDINNVTTCHNLLKIAVLVFRNTKIPSKDMINILSCLQAYPDMFVVSLQNSSWDSLPDEFIRLFPNLQSLDLIGNKFVSPPHIFPWSERLHILAEDVSMPRNMDDVNNSSRSCLYHPANGYRIVTRSLYLDNNLIHDLSEFSFHGCLHLLSLKGNGIVAISGDIFVNVIGLRHIDLSNNILKYVPSRIFRGMPVLNKLDLGDNKIQNLNKTVFKDLQALKFLSLKNNLLSFLPDGLFNQLMKLEILHLENNFLTVMNADTFSLPYSSSFLQEIYVNRNPIKVFPEFIFRLRELRLANLAYTDISFAFLLNMNSTNLLSSITDTTHYFNKDVWKQRAVQLKDINLSNCNITSFPLKTITNDMKIVLTVLLQNFRFNLDANPLQCDCSIIPITNFIRDLRDAGTVKADEYYFTEWICQAPEELLGQYLLDVQDDKTYCLVENLTNCPAECKCFNRSGNHSIIIDCRKRNLDSIHSQMPEGILELWYNGNNISRVSQKPFFQRVRNLDVSDNNIIAIAGKVFRQAENLKVLNLQSNRLEKLPETLMGLMYLEKVILLNNHFKCDCHSLWMKYWIRKNRDIITDWNELACISQSEETTIVDVNDSDFVCPEYNSHNNVLPLITCTVIVVLLCALGAIAVVYRLEIKVILYVYLGIRPFDNSDENLNEILDCVIVHSKTATDWVMENIVEHLESDAYGFVVCDMGRDFLVGFSIQENLTHMVNYSKRIIFCLSDDWQITNESFKLSWNIAEKKIKETKANYGIIVSRGLTTNKIEDKLLLRYIKRDRFLDSSKRLFFQKLIYAMPRKREKKKKEQKPDPVDKQPTLSMRDVSILLSESVADKQQQKYNVFISYTSDNIALVRKYFMPLLELEGYRLYIEDRDFPVGESMAEVISDAIEFSNRTLILLTECLPLDSWQLFTFMMAYEKTLKEKSNHLILIMKDGLDSNMLDKRIKDYLDSYVCLYLNDRWFLPKLFQ